MKELVEYLASALVDNPEPVVVTQEGADESPTFSLKVGDDDLGKVIGKKGRTAKALRTLLAAVGQKQGLRVYLEIIEPPRRRRGEKPALQNTEETAGKAERQNAELVLPEAVIAQSSEAETQSAETQSAETQSAETQSAETQSAETQSAETQSAETQSAETQSAETQNAERAEAFTSESEPRRSRARKAPVADVFVEENEGLRPEPSANRRRRTPIVDDEKTAPVRRRAPSRAPAIERVAPLRRAPTEVGEEPPLRNPRRRRAPAIERKAPLIERKPSLERGVAFTRTPSDDET